MSRLTDGQAQTLKRALNGSVRASYALSLPSLVRRGLMHRIGGRPGHISYGITELGKQVIARHIIEKSASPQVVEV